MMDARERIKSALTMAEFDRVPIDNRFGGEMQIKYPSDVVGPPYRYPAGRSIGSTNKKGCYTDIWGCVWEAGEDGVTGEVKDSPVHGGWSSLNSYKPPFEVIENAVLSEVNCFCAGIDKFVIPMWESAANPFERMQHLRGTEQFFMDLAYLDSEIYNLRDMVHEYFFKQFELWVRTDIDAVHIADDWGAQQSLLISPEQWRSFFKPLYRDYCELAHAHGKFVLMHSDGFIMDIIPDLIEIGVDALNSQLFCMPIELLAEKFAGQICFWGEIDRQHLLPFGSVDEVRTAVRRVASAFFNKKRTGIVGQCFWGKDHRNENCEAVYEEWSKW
jgi:hypothetical protein